MDTVNVMFESDCQYNIYKYRSPVVGDVALTKHSKYLFCSGLIVVGEFSYNGATVLQLKNLGNGTTFTESIGYVRAHYECLG